MHPGQDLNEMLAPRAAPGRPRSLAEARAVQGRLGRARALHEARVEVLGGGLGADVLDLDKAGWTPQTYRWLLRLAEHAGRVGAAISRWDAAEPGKHRLTAERLDHLCEPLTACSRVPLRKVTPWLTLLASDPDEDRSRALREGLAEWTLPHDNLLRCAEWSRRIGDAAAVAWAAGLSITEAEARVVAGTLARAELRLLAGLRGYRLPNFEHLSTRQHHEKAGPSNRRSAAHRNPSEQTPILSG